MKLDEKYFFDKAILLDEPTTTAGMIPILRAIAGDAREEQAKKYMDILIKMADSANIFTESILAALDRAKGE